LFFFSSRRRHTRSDRDWSSDVCSSDLIALYLLGFELRDPCLQLLIRRDERVITRGIHIVAMVIGPPGAVVQRAVEQPPPKKAVIRVIVNHDRTRIVRPENGLDPDGPR